MDDLFRDPHEWVAKAEREHDSELCTGKSCATCFLHWILWGEVYIEKLPSGQFRHISPANIKRITRVVS